MRELRQKREEVRTLSPRCGQRGNPGKCLIVFISQAQGSCRNILLEMFDRGSPWDGQHNGRPMQKPVQRYLRSARTVGLGDSVKHFARNLARSQWEPGDKRSPIAST